LECILNQVDPQFESTQGFNYRLSILLCQDGYSFLVTHAVSQRVMRMASYKLNHIAVQHDEMGGWPINGNDYFDKLKTIDLIHLSYQRVDIAVASQKITIAPNPFLEPGNALNIISAAHPVSPGEEILTDPLYIPGPVTASLIPRYIPEFCATIFPGSVLRCAAAVFVKGILRKHSLLIARQVFINVHPGFFEITVIQGLRLLYLNVFKYSAPSDVLYYVIFVLEQLGFVPSEEKVTLMGEITESSVIYSQLKMYCESLQFVEKPEELKFGEKFTRVALHNYFILLNIPVCE
jgi:hypothetical protein